MTKPAEITVNGVSFRFVRRRYNCSKTFTWLHWKDESGQWHAYVGDPWPSVVIPRKDLEKIAAELKALAAQTAVAMDSVCEMFDATIIRDYWPGTDEHPEAGHPLFALGQKAELNAGLRGFRMTPFFDTLQMLQAFCTRNLVRFREFHDANPDDAPPDASNWL